MYIIGPIPDPCTMLQFMLRASGFSIMFDNMLTVGEKVDYPVVKLLINREIC